MIKLIMPDQTLLALFLPSFIGDNYFLLPFYDDFPRLCVSILLSVGSYRRWYYIFLL